VRFRQHEHQRPTFVLLASRWKPEEHKNGGVRKAAAHASKPEASLQEWRSQSLNNKPEDFVFLSERLQGSEPSDLASVLKKKIQPAFRRIGITGVGWHTFRHSVGTMLAEMSEHQLTIRDYLRHSNLHVTNKYLQATSKTKRLGQDKLVDAILPTGILPKTNLIQ
jgi:integrase